MRFVSDQRCGGASLSVGASVAVAFGGAVAGWGVCEVIVTVVGAKRPVRAA